MARYRVTRKSDSAHVYEYEAAAPVEWIGMEFATHDHDPIAEPAPSPPPAPAPVRVTKLAFRNRFTQAEKVAIELTAADNPASSAPARQLAAALRAQLADQRDALWIDLQRADTRAGVQQLEALGLIGAGRAAVILDTPPTPLEVYVG